MALYKSVNYYYYYYLIILQCFDTVVGQQEGHPACKKSEWWGVGLVICMERGADLHTAQLMPLPLTVSCSSKIQIGFTFLVPAHLGSPGKKAVKRVCVSSSDNLDKVATQSYESWSNSQNGMGSKSSSNSSGVKVTGWQHTDESVVDLVVTLQLVILSEPTAASAVLFGVV